MNDKPKLILEHPTGDIELIGHVVEDLIVIKRNDFHDPDKHDDETHQGYLGDGVYAN